MGTVGTMIAQNMAMHIPNKNTGIQGIMSDYLMATLV